MSNIDNSGDLKVSGTLTANQVVSTQASITNAMLSANAAIARSKLAQDALAKYLIPYTAFRVWDAMQTNLPGTPAADDLALDGDTFGTGSPHLTAGDLGSAGATTRYARCQLWLPPEYDDGQTISLRLHAGMQTAIADNSCTADIECYKSDAEVGIGSDLCTTAATSINSLTFADYDFTITPTGLVSGDILDVRLTIACNDAATGTVEPTIGAAYLLLDIKG